MAEAAASRTSDVAVRSLWAGIILVVLITVAHYATPPDAMRIHDVLTRLYYVPIVFVGARCGRKAGTGIAVLVALAFFPHLFTHLGGDPLEKNLNRSFEIVLWIVVGYLTGYYSDRERATREAAEASALAAREAARGLLEAQAQLRQADRLATLGLLSANLAHEVRNPLASLKGIADLLRAEFPAGHARKELIDILDQEVQRLDGVVGNYLESARPARDDGRAGLREVVEGVRALLDAEARKRGVRISAEVSPPDIVLPLAKDLLRQLLVNFVLNSLEAVGHGGTVWMRASRTQTGTDLVVDDDGPGFPRELEGQEPRPFFTTRSHGTGLGLPIARGIVESHGGRLRLENRPEGGARVVVSFPQEPKP
ncbi:MAG: ATP-binding protein [Planctomycetes bacterium]|nr:ATP-binding protein [Planctomycetota bacterium]